MDSEIERCPFPCHCSSSSERSSHDLDNNATRPFYNSASPADHCVLTLHVDSPCSGPWTMFTRFPNPEPETRPQLVNSTTQTKKSLHQDPHPNPLPFIRTTAERNRHQNRKPFLLNRVWCSGNIVDSHFVFNKVSVFSTAPGSTPGIRAITIFTFLSCLSFFSATRVFFH